MRIFFLIFFGILLAGSFEQELLALQKKYNHSPLKVDFQKHLGLQNDSEYQQLWDDTVHELKSSDYARKEYQHTNSALESYTVFYVEYLMMKQTRNFQYSSTKTTPAMQNMLNTCKKMGVSENKIARILNNSKSAQYEWNGVHFYMRPSSVSRQRSENTDLGAKILREGMNEGRAFIKKYNSALLNAEQEFGVPKEIIVATLQVETNFGDVELKYHALNVLNGLLLNMFVPFGDKNPARQQRRIQRLLKGVESDFANLLVYSVKQNINPFTLKSNLVGAMGIPQFMPRNLKFARDGNKDGRADLMQMEDAIFSVANFYVQNGWTRETLDSSEARLYARLRTYNNSDAYCDAVLNVARALARTMKK